MTGAWWGVFITLHLIIGVVISLASDNPDDGIGTGLMLGVLLLTVVTPFAAAAILVAAAILR